MFRRRLAAVRSRRGHYGGIISLAALENGLVQDNGAGNSLVQRVQSSRVAAAVGRQGTESGSGAGDMI